MMTATKPSSEQIKKMRSEFPPNSKVMAIKVRDVDVGETGFVCSVYENGNVLVAWSSGRLGEVQYLEEQIRVLGDGTCILGRVASYQQGSCGEGTCRDCGWNSIIAEKRKEMIRAGLMVDRKDGTKMLKVRKKGGRERII